MIKLIKHNLRLIRQTMLSFDQIFNIHISITNGILRDIFFLKVIFVRRLGAFAAKFIVFHDFER